MILVDSRAEKAVDLPFPRRQGTAASRSDLSGSCAKMFFHRRGVSPREFEESAALGTKAA